MKKYLWWLILAIFITFFIHSFNKNRILNYNRTYEEKKELFSELSSVNKSLKKDYQYYTSDEYIQKRAIEDLGMVFVSSYDTIENMVLNHKSENYSTLYVVKGDIKGLKNIK